LPGFCGKDLLVALNSQGVDIPIIVLAQKGMEQDVIQSLRLGATDYMIWPMREAEVINVVERGLKVVHERRERDRLSKQLQQMNQELQSRVRELTTIFAVGKAVTSITDQTTLFGKIVDGAMKVTQADLGWFLLREEGSKAFLQVASINLPASMAGSTNQAWDDGISSLVAMSGEALAICGEPLKRFKIYTLGQSALIVPIKVQKEVIGLLVMMRKKPLAFSSSEQHLLDAVADYASISLVNARLFRAVEDRARSLQMNAENAQIGLRINDGMLQTVKKEMRRPLDAARTTFDRITKDPTAHWNSDQRQLLGDLQEQMQLMTRILESVEPFQQPEKRAASGKVNLAEVLQDVVNSYQHYAHQNELSLAVDIQEDPVWVTANSNQVRSLAEALLSNAIKYSNSGGKITVTLEPSRASMAHFWVRDQGTGIEEKSIPHVFDEHQSPSRAGSARFGGLGISLHLVQDLVASYNGKVWFDSKVGQGTTFHIAIPVAH
ncbi:MAG: GAF domain-containing protein, partial [Anaerolineaceae bacterium]|nr:GAF domain-containing protein [Anaerolineaceae bacterium]